MKLFFGSTLILIAALTGGCSLFYAIASPFFTGEARVITEIAPLFYISGFVISGFCLWIFILLRKARETEDPPR